MQPRERLLLQVMEPGQRADPAVRVDAPRERLLERREPVAREDPDVDLDALDEREDPVDERRALAHVLSEPASREDLVERLARLAQDEEVEVGLGREEALGRRAGEDEAVALPAEQRLELGVRDARPLEQRPRRCREAAAQRGHERRTRTVSSRPFSATRLSTRVTPAWYGSASQAAIRAARSGERRPYRTR